ncbi:peptidoglycan DD-metalloendopeptidase family protein [Streptomyces sp. NBC_00102]|uniref:peptidoglycan DD-metalloendopeptidase family protein n=1 Tax=Streptomyces sp. NBC_00102 TaxID=2975652 RepID=UPI00225801B4|nr:peptidoglycan DD-metalloendopeptidase family protein [Streptomyces sp. NBC_00102]MCX5399215.1 peptidoglycan DD-metalloendopeptidase family protein [Streptomyces sp. NBC_00102]
MNDQHTHAGYAGYDTSQTGSYPAGPLYGTLPGEHGVAPGSGYDSDFAAGPTAAAHHGAYPGQDTTYATGSSWESGGAYDAYAAESLAAHQHAYDTTGSRSAGAPDETGQWDSSAWQQAATHTTTGQWSFTDTGAFPTTTFESSLSETGTYQAAAPVTGTYEAQGGYDTAGYAAAPSAYGTDDTRYGPTAHTTGAYDTGIYGTGIFENGTHSTGAYDIGHHDTTGVFDTRAFEAADGYGATTGYDSPGYDTPASGTPAYAAPTAFATGAYDTGAYDATAWNTASDPDATPGATAYVPEQMSYAPAEHHEAVPEHQVPEHQNAEHQAPEHATDGPEVSDSAEDPSPAPESGEPSGLPDTWPDPYQPEVHSEGRPEGRSAARNRARRRTPAKRSALLTIAVPSACVMGVAGIAAASVGGLGGTEETKDDTTTMAAADTAGVKALASNTKLDTQLAGVSAAGEDFRDRASRTQERIDLKERQAADKKKREEEAARKEAARPKYLLPVAQHGLSAYFGQAGVNWMSVHTGIDFPVQYGTPVMAATDGTVRTQWNSAYGNMAIVTMEDGTETWYCHLSSTKIRSGSVKAGDVIAYSGNSGNSTGPHLHFEVRPGGGAAVNPLPWLASHGLNPQ